MDNNIEKTNDKTRLVLNRTLYITGIVLCVIFALVLIFNLSIIIQGAFYIDRVPGVFGITPLIVLSPSMENSAEGYENIKSGDLIFINQTVSGDFKVGDIVTFWSDDGILITHRISRITTDENGIVSYFTKGDNPENSEDRGRRKQSDIVGAYMFKLNGMGRVSMFLKSAPGIMCIVAIPLFLMLALYAIQKSLKNNSAEREKLALQNEIERMKKEQSTANFEAQESQITEKPSKGAQS